MPCAPFVFTFTFWFFSVSFFYAVSTFFILLFYWNSFPFTFCHAFLIWLAIGEMFFYQIIMEIPLELMLTISKKVPWMFLPDIVPVGHPIFDIINSTNPEVSQCSI